MIKVEASTTIEALVHEISAGYDMAKSPQVQRCIDALHGELLFTVKSLWRTEPAVLAQLFSRLSLPLLLKSELLKIAEMNQLPSPYQIEDGSDVAFGTTSRSIGSPSVSKSMSSISVSSSSEETTRSALFTHSLSSPSSNTSKQKISKSNKPHIPTLQLPATPRVMDGQYSPKQLPPIIDDPIFDQAWNTKFKMEDEPEKRPHPVVALEKPITSAGITLKQVPFALARKGPDPCFVVVFQVDEEFDLFKPIESTTHLKGLKSTSVGSEFLAFQRPDAKGIQCWLQNRFGGSFQITYDQPVIQKMLDMEMKAPIFLNEYRISVIYCRKGQVDPMDMFKNEQDMLSVDAKEFFQLMLQINPATVDPAFLSDGIKNIWEDRTFLWHFAPIMNEEQQRSFIGNNNAVLFFKDEGEAFNPSLVANMGAMPQVFIVVQPFKGAYRIGCFKKALIAPYKPYISSEFLFTKESCRTTVLTKLANGLMTAIQCPPLLSLISRPRQEAMNQILATLKPPRKQHHSHHSKTTST